MGGAPVGSVSSAGTGILCILGGVEEVSRSLPPGSLSPDVGAENPHCLVRTAKARLHRGVAVVSVLHTSSCCGGSGGPFVTYPQRRTPGSKTQSTAGMPRTGMASGRD